VVASAFAYLWQRFLWLGWIGKLVVVVVLLYGVGWLFGAIGMEEAACEFGSAGAVVLALLLTALVIRLIWRRHAGRLRV
jgi:membrane protein DedA with SNARE-associated domain